MPARGRRYSAYPIYLFLQGALALSLAMAWAVNLVYQVQTAHLNALQLVLVGTALEGTILVLQIPTGVLADVYSRRLSVLVGIVFLGAGVILQGAIATFGAILLSSVADGIGYTFLSGAEEAWIAAEVGEERLGQVFLRGSQVAQVGALVGIAIGTALATIRLNLPLLVGGALLLMLGVLLAFIMPERGFARVAGAERAHWRALVATFRGGAGLVRSSPLLLTILALTALAGMSSEGFDRLNVAHFLQDFTLPPLGPLKPVVWFGLMGIVGRLLGLAATEVARRRLDTRRHTAVTRALLALTGLLTASIVAFGLAGSFAVALSAF